MIPTGLTITRVAFGIWKDGIGTLGTNSLAALDDETLHDTYQAISALLRDVEDAYALARELLVRRVMATTATAENSTQ